MADLDLDWDGEAPGQPGIAPTWTSSAKDIVGCSLGRSRIWFTLGYGIVNEVYYPRVDSPQIRDLGFIVADGAGFWVEVKRLQDYAIRLLAPGTPAVEIVHRHSRFTLTLRVTPDPDRDVLIIAYRLDGDAALKPYVLLAPRLGTTGRDNVAAIVRHGIAPRAGGGAGTVQPRSRRGRRPPARTPSARPARVMSGQATAGRISIATAP